jgi:hypothetical protein
VGPLAKTDVKGMDEFTTTTQQRAAAEETVLSGHSGQNNTLGSLSPQSACFQHVTQADLALRCYKQRRHTSRAEQNMTHPS